MDKLISPPIYIFLLWAGNRPILLQRKGWYTDGLTLKQKKFADEYIISGNKYEAAILAGYSEKYAKAQSHKLLDNVGIKAYIDERLEEINSKKIADQKEILEYLTSVMRGEQTDQTFKGIGEGVQEITEVRVSAKDRIKAAELLGKRYSIWTDKVDSTESVSITFIDDYGDDTE